MPFTRSDAIAGTIYVIASDAEDAQRRVFDYLRDKSEDYGVFEERRGADSALYDRHRFDSGSDDRLYSVSLDIRVAD